MLTVYQDSRKGKEPGYRDAVTAREQLLGDEKQPHQIAQPFAISTYPVTNGQYELFVKAEGYKNSEWWTEAGWEWREENNVTAPVYWRDGKWNRPNLPVVGVCAHEADAFATWAGVRLPTKEEWEAAARGTDGRVYPWGDEWEAGRCNSYELSELRRTSPVGAFPRSQTVFGCGDMSGNVWEWVAGEGSERVLRGGSWFNGARYCRCSNRNSNHANNRYVSTGFRVVSCFPRTQ